MFVVLSLDGWEKKLFLATDNENNYKPVKKKKKKKW